MARKSYHFLLLLRCCGEYRKISCLNQSCSNLKILPFLLFLKRLLEDVMNSSHEFRNWSFGESNIEFLRANLTCKICRVLCPKIATSDKNTYIYIYTYTHNDTTITCTHIYLYILIVLQYSYAIIIISVIFCISIWKAMHGGHKSNAYDF